MVRGGERGPIAGQPPATAGASAGACRTAVGEEESGSGYADVRAIVFDFDGVLVESADIKTEAFLALFAFCPEHHGVIRNYHLAHQGISRYAKFEWIYREVLRQPLSARESAQLGSAFTDIVFDRVLECPFVAGARALLDACHGRIPLFVASGTPEDELQSILERRGLARYFEDVWGSPTSKAAALTTVLQRFALSVHEVLFVGDSVSDRDAAVQTNVRFVARRTEQNAGAWLRLGTDAVADMRGLHDRLEGLLQER